MHSPGLEVAKGAFKPAPPPAHLTHGLAPTNAHQLLDLSPNTQSMHQGQPTPIPRPKLSEHRGQPTIPHHNSHTPSTLHHSPLSLDPVHPNLPLPQPFPSMLQSLKSYNLQFRAKPVWQNVQANLCNWAQLACKDQVLLQSLEKGLVLHIQDKPSPARYHRCPPALELELQSELVHLEEKGAVRRLSAAEMANTSCWTPLLGRRKPSGELRVITNLIFYNKVFPCPKTRILTWKHLIQVLGDYSFTHCAQLDFQDAYNHMPLHNKTSRWIRAKVGNVGYQWRCMPFGLSVGSYWCERMFRPLISQLQAWGTTAVIYSDNLLVLGRSAFEVQIGILRAVHLCNRLGITINWPKSEPDPVTQTDFLGQHLDLTAHTITLPLHKTKPLESRLEHILRRQQTTPKELASLAGQLLDATKGSLLLQGLARQVSQQSAPHIAHKTWWRWTWTPWLAQLLSKALQALRTQVPVPIPALHPQATITTDAAHHLWGAHLSIQDPPTTMSTQGWWVKHEQSQTSNWKETKAIGLALLAFLPFLLSLPCPLPLRTVEVLTDNQTARAVWTKGSKHSHLNNCARWVKAVLALQGVALIITYLPGLQNSLADKLSRRASCVEDYRVHPQVVYHLSRHFVHPILLDLFAARHNRVCKQFVSRMPQPGAKAVDAFKLGWGNLPGLWANPPFSLMDRVLTKVARDRAQMLLIFPVWCGRPWWSKLAALAATPAVILPPGPFLSPSGAQMPPPRWKTAAVMLNGALWDRRAQARPIQFLPLNFRL